MPASFLVDLPDSVTLNAGYSRVPDAGQRVPLVLEVAEVMQPVLNDRTADRGAELLVAHRHDDSEHRIFRIQLAVAEIGAEQS